MVPSIAPGHPIPDDVPAAQAVRRILAVPDDASDEAVMAALVERLQQVDDATDALTSLWNTEFCRLFNRALEERRVALPDRPAWRRLFEAEPDLARRALETPWRTAA